MTGTIAQWIRILDRIAPPRLAESWDNVGLQIGSRNWPVKKIWTALDPLPDVVERACENDVDLLVTHHPLFFKPVRHLDVDSPVGRIVRMAMTGRLAIFSAHTNLDSVSGGINDILCRRIGLADCLALSGGVSVEMRKLVVFVPHTHVKTILDTLFDQGAGKIADYTCCSFRCDGIGTFLPGHQSRPAIGKSGTLSEVNESRIEIRLAQADEARVVAALKAAHPYETMAYDSYPLSERDPHSGLGRVGELPVDQPLEQLATHLKANLGLTTVKVVGTAGQMVRRVAVCSGSGGSLLGAAVATGAQVYVSGDLGYHTARDAQQAGIALIDVGHFGSERVIVDALAGAIREAAAAEGLAVAVEPADMEVDPFFFL